MADNTYTWRISNMERHTATGAVYVLHWTCDCVSDDGVYRQGAYGSVGLDEPGEDMIPFADLTEEQCIQWLHAKLGEETIAKTIEALDNAVSEMRAPSKAAGVPWS